MKRYFASTKGVLSFLIFCFSFTPASAQNQNTDLIANQLNRIQRDLQMLSRQVFKGPAPQNQSQTVSKPRASSTPNAYIIRVEDRLSQLDGETRQNTGNIESITHTLNQISARLDSLGNDINFRLTSIEKNLNFLTRNPQAGQQAGGTPADPLVQPITSPSLSVAPRSKSVKQIGSSTGGVALGRQPGTLGTVTQRELNDVRGDSSAKKLGSLGEKFSTTNRKTQILQQRIVPKTYLPSGTPMEKYKFAFGLVRKQEFLEAILALEEFIHTHPGEPLTDNARNWLGRTHYVRKDYQNAAKVFLIAYQAKPRGKKAADNLFRLGLSLAGLKKIEDACATFDKLDQDFPKSNSIIKKQLIQQRKKIGCG